MSCDTGSMFVLGEGTSRVMQQPQLQLPLTPLPAGPTLSLLGSGDPLHRFWVQALAQSRPSAALSWLLRWLLAINTIQNNCWTCSRLSSMLQRLRGLSATREGLGLLGLSQVCHDNIVKQIC